MYFVINVDIILKNVEMDSSETVYGMLTSPLAYSSILCEMIHGQPICDE